MISPRPGRQGLVVAAEPLDGVIVALRHLAHAHESGDHDERRDDEREDGCALQDHGCSLIKPSCGQAAAAASLAASAPAYDICLVRGLPGAVTRLPQAPSAFLPQRRKGAIDEAARQRHAFSATKRKEGRKARS